MAVCRAANASSDKITIIIMSMAGLVRIRMVMMMVGSLVMTIAMVAIVDGDDDCKDVWGRGRTLTCLTN